VVPANSPSQFSRGVWSFLGEVDRGVGRSGSSGRPIIWPVAAHRKLAGFLKTDPSTKTLLPLQGRSLGRRARHGSPTQPAAGNRFRRLFRTHFIGLLMVLRGYGFTATLKLVVTGSTAGVFLGACFPDSAGQVLGR